MNIFDFMLNIKRFLIFVEIDFIVILILIDWLSMDVKYILIILIIFVGLVMFVVIGFCVLVFKKLLKLKFRNIIKIKFFL